MITNPYIPAVIFTAADMSQATLISDVIAKGGYGNVGISLNWTGAPTGTIGCLISNYPVIDERTVGLSFSNFPMPAGTASQLWLDVATSAAYIWVLYTKTSGTGFLNGSVVVNQ